VNESDLSNASIDFDQLKQMLDNDDQVDAKIDGALFSNAAKH